MICTYATGRGNSHKFCGAYDATFGRRMVGTFNVKAPDAIMWFAPAIMDSTRTYWLAEINGRYRVWAMRYAGSLQLPRTYELLSKEPLPDELKTGEFELEVLEPWSREKIDAWGRNMYWFQDFPWAPKHRADSGLIWRTIQPHCDWGKSRVLDIGCGYGYHTMKAAKMGAVAMGIERGVGGVGIARAINDHIEMTDARFVVGDARSLGACIGDEQFDVILYLSVHHQFDKGYATLGATIDHLVRLAPTVFVETFAGSLDGGMSEAEVDAIVGGEVLARYKHRVRGIRKIYMRRRQ